MKRASRFPLAFLLALLLAGCADFQFPGRGPTAPDESVGGDDTLARCRQAQREDRRKLEQLANQLREERQKSDALQQKIDALREIDREMTLKRRP